MCLSYVVAYWGDLETRNDRWPYGLLNSAIQVAGLFLDARGSALVPLFTDNESAIPPDASRNYL